MIPFIAFEFDMTKGVFLPKRLNVTIIVLDTLRQDAFNRITQRHPNLLDGIGMHFFDNCIAPGSWTLPSHASLFTGLYQSDHNCHETSQIKSLDIDRIRLRMPTIVDDLKRKKYFTYAISANPYIGPIYGFSGFDKYEEESYFTDVYGSVLEISKELKPRVSKYRDTYGNDIMKLASAIIKEDPRLFLDLASSAALLSPMAVAKKAKAKFIDKWPIEKGGRRIVKKVGKMELKEPFFLFLNLMEAHDPYIGGRGNDMNWATPFLKNRVDESRVKKWKEIYNAASYRALKYASQIMRDLIERFGENQIIILTSDHGQEFGEHNFIGHGTVISDEVVKVPLAIHVPKDFKIDNNNYQSLVNIREFVNSAAFGIKDSPKKLCTRRVYSEAFSIPANISSVKGIDPRLVRKFDKYKRRVFD